MATRSEGDTSVQRNIFLFPLPLVIMFRFLPVYTMMVVFLSRDLSKIVESSDLNLLTLCIHLNRTHLICSQDGTTLFL